MTQRKPHDLSFDSWIDAQIREARERGLFDDLTGAGKPQQSLRDAEDPLWWAKQFLQREQLSYLPAAIEVRVRAQKLRELLAHFPSERAVREAAEALNSDIRRVNRSASHGPPTRQAPLDVDALIASWQAARAEGVTAPSAPRRDSGTMNLAQSGSAASPSDARCIRRARFPRPPRPNREP